VSALLREANIGFDWRLSQQHPPRECCTQYEESDHDFLRRLMAEYGIAFRFRHALAGEAWKIIDDDLVLADDAYLYAPISLGKEPYGEWAPAHALPWLAGDGAPATARDRVDGFASRQRLSFTAASYSKFDPARPEALLTASERIDGVGDGALEHYEHHAPYPFRKWEFGHHEPKRILRQKRRRASVTEGTSFAPSLSPGRAFRLEGHPIERLNTEYAEVRLRHRGWAMPSAERRESYKNSFECVPADVTYFRPRPKRRNVLVALTATVVGAGEDETHADAEERIKVQFRWDRDGKKDEKSSCRIRAMQGSGGQGWGGQFIPRAGLEVVVAFDGGDADKPLVLGCVYNVTRPLPFRVPEEKTRSGIRTCSTPRAAGFNELSFQDKAGAEQVFVRAERDLVEQVGHDHTVNVSHGQRVSVSGDESTCVTGSRLHETLGAEVVKTLGDSEQHVGGERMQRVGGGERRVTDGDEVVRVAGRAVHSIGGNDNLRTDATFSVEAGTRERPGTIDFYSWGHPMVGAGLGIALRADQSISFSCGESSIESSKDAIKRHAPKLRPSASEEIGLSGDGPHLFLDKRAELTADNVRIYSSKASIDLDEDAHIDGKRACDTNAPSELCDDDGKPLTQPLRLQLTDSQYEPYAGKEFVVKAGGARAEVMTSGDGSLEVAIPSAAGTAEVTLRLDKRPSGRGRFSSTPGSARSW